MSSRGIMFQWEGKRLYRQKIPKPRLLEPVKGLSVGDDSPNMIVEGDTLQVLTSLKARYEGEVNVIYADPPYNLGTEDFRYSDKRFHDPDADDSDAVYVNNEDGGKHTKWLNVMAPTFHMLWECLSDTGILFVSINDVELFRLGMLLNEIFDEENHVGTLVWHGSTDNNPSQIVTEHEYILCYAKKKSRLQSIWTGRQVEARDLMLKEYERIKSQTSDLAEIQKQFRAFVKQNSESLQPLTHYNRVDKLGPYTGLRAVHNPGKDGHFYDIPHPRTKKACRVPVRGYRFPPDSMQQMIDADDILFGKDHTALSATSCISGSEVEESFRGGLDLLLGQPRP